MVLGGWDRLLVLPASYLFLRRICACKAGTLASWPRSTVMLMERSEGRIWRRSGIGQCYVACVTGHLEAFSGGHQKRVEEQGAGGRASPHQALRCAQGDRNVPCHSEPFAEGRRIWGGGPGIGQYHQAFLLAHREAPSGGCQQREAAHEVRQTSPHQALRSAQGDRNVSCHSEPFAEGRRIWWGWATSTRSFTFGSA